MKTFCVAYITFFDNELKQELVKASDSVQAMLGSSFLKGWVFTEPNESVIKETLFNADAIINVLEVKPCQCKCHME